MRRTRQLTIEAVGSPEPKSTYARNLIRLSRTPTCPETPDSEALFSELEDLGLLGMDFMMM